MQQLLCNQDLATVSADSRGFSLKNLREMASEGQSLKNDQPSIKYKCTPLKTASFDLADRGQEDVFTIPDSHRQSEKQSESKSCNNMMSTTKFISAVGGIWDSVNQPSAFFHPKANENHNDACLKENIICYADGGRNNKTSVYAETEFFHIDLKSSSCFPPTVNSNFVRIVPKMPFFKLCSGHDNSSFFWRYLSIGNSHVPVESWRISGLACVRISYDLEKLYGLVCEKPSLGLKASANFSQTEWKDSPESFVLKNNASPAEISDIRSIDCSNTLNRFKDCPGSETVEFIGNLGKSFSFLHAAYLIRPVTELEETATSLRTLSSSLYSDYHLKCFAIDNCQQLPESCLAGRTPEDISASHGNSVREDCRGQIQGSSSEDEPPKKLSLLIPDKAEHTIAKQRHALAGALAGTFVSLCLHPVDTIKTVIQARSAGQNSLCSIFGSIISERGVTGLYRGIASNIASSAPISAVYTFTYESVKGALLPLMPKEYHSLAHCTAGGCASIATSFIFTPSECIKQQMQVGSQYQSCWNALVGILEKGGLPSLYAGWGAVLCRNIPHSVIKFYTYESLKQLMLSSAQSNAPPIPNTLQTLVCGGLAGSTAALFTTPFDVVKTRLQTQNPGSLKQYNGVIHALQEIAKHEGLEGLYKGLTPRLVMYISQGALFFSSYEILKRVFSFDVLQLPAPTIQRENKDDD